MSSEMRKRGRVPSEQPRDLMKALRESLEVATGRVLSHGEWLREQGRVPDPAGACWQQFQNNAGVVVRCTCGYDRAAMTPAREQS